jgi:hypothetical protein
MEVAGLAVGIIALYSTCRDCYQFFTSVQTAESESSSHLRELEIQQSILKAWGMHWQIQQIEDNEGQDSAYTERSRTKLHDYFVRNPYKADGVFKTLSALADTLSDQHKLVRRYGIQLRSGHAIQDVSDSTNNVRLAIADTTIKDVNPVISEVRSRLSTLNKLKWALKDRTSFKQLIYDLKSHSDSLYRLCPENAFESMNIFVTMDCLAGQEVPADLKSFSKLAIEQAQGNEDSSTGKGYRLLATVAGLKARVNENRGGQQSDETSLSTIEEEERSEMIYLGKSLALYQREVVYVEMRDYRGRPLEPTPEQKQRQKRIRQKERILQQNPSQYIDSDEDEDESHGDPFELVRLPDPRLRTLIKNFYNTFHGASMRESVCGLDMAGMIDHVGGEHKGHCSILYRLPGTIGAQGRERPAENLKLRAPVTLLSLLGAERKPGIKSTLGARFELARKLVRAVCLLHSTGWLHKNIRAESVIFFPKHVSKLQEDRYEVKVEIDVSQPILMGYLFSRPDDISKPRPTPTPEPDHALPLTYAEDSYSFTQDMSFGTDVYSPPKDYSGINDRTRNGPAQSHRRTVMPRAASIYGRNMLTHGNPVEKTKETIVGGFILDYYQHPAKHADPKRLYRHAYDVYSLGILLLEVGLWEQLQNYDDVVPGYGAGYLGRSGYNVAPGFDRDSNWNEEDHYERRRWICTKYLDRLRWSCGDLYADVVLSCLMVDSSDDEVAKASQRELCARIVADLEGCQA